jgi:hypothetical protein
MRAIKKLQTVDAAGKISIEVPRDFDSKVEVIILPYPFEGEDWTDEEWQNFTLHSFKNTEDDKNVDWEDFFAVKNR